jgi:hypothetical protein
VDPDKWYYIVNAGDRFSIPAELYYVITDNGEPSGVIGFIDVQYIIEFAGAAVTSLTSLSSVSSYDPDTPRPDPSKGQEARASGYVSISRPTSLRK